MVKFVNVDGVKGEEFVNGFEGVGEVDVKGCKVVMVVNGLKVVEKDGKFVVCGGYDGLGIEIGVDELNVLVESGKVVEYEKYIGLVVDEDGLMSVESVDLCDYEYVNMIFWNGGSFGDVFESCKVGDVVVELVDFENSERDLVGSGESGGFVEKFKCLIENVDGVCVRWSIEYDDNLGMLIK